MSYSITSHRSFYNEYGDRMDADQQTEIFDCTPDDIDTDEGLNHVDLAVNILRDKLYVTESSSYPFSPGSWYYRMDEADMLSPDGAVSEEMSAHLEGFSADEEREIYVRAI